LGCLQALDYVIAEARQHGIRLLLSLVNNWHDFGGKAQYIKWARATEEGTVGLSASNDSFFFNPSIRSNFKNYIKVYIWGKFTFNP
jgi:mannan endo-1,4-beta-mannosidase